MTSSRPEPPFRRREGSRSPPPSHASQTARPLRGLDHLPHTYDVIPTGAALQAKGGISVSTALSRKPNCTTTPRTRSFADIYDVIPTGAALQAKGGISVSTALSRKPNGTTTPRT